MIEKFFQTLTEHIQKQTPDLNTGETILEFLYECYSEHNNLEDAQIKADFEALYEAMNGMDLHEMDQIIYPICTLCRTHQRSGFEHGVRIGVALAGELSHHKNES